ncbi:zinc-finger-containing protein [Lacrimispora sp.]|uniref:zinc-finger-containing protein n=1 Tax=Lacrimispora sp. TaxID=2719234 RepID=UPI002FD8DA94
MVNTQPTECNLCDGKVVYISNAKIYGKQYGSGYCYYCTSCGAFVGTHEPRPREALGILANKEMREWKIKCHGLFDPLWKSKKKKRAQLYSALASQMGIPMNQCHFGYFDLVELKRAYEILKTWS